MSKIYVVAVSKKEAAELAPMIGHNSRAGAEKHLAEVQAPPTDPSYAKMYRVFELEVGAAGVRAQESK